MKILQSVLFCLITAQPVLGQFHRKEYKDRLIISSPGIVFQGQTYVDINFLYSKYDEGHGNVVIWGPRIGMELKLNSTHFVYAPKIGYELAGFPIILRGSAITYIDNGQTDLRLVPEAGLSFFGLINLTYGYNFQTLSFRTSEISNHRFGLTINLDFDVWRGL